MATRDTMGLIAALAPELMDRAVAMRSDQESYDSIARYLSNGVGMDVGRESVRRYFKALEKLAE
jgi:hypothetical protein